MIRLGARGALRIGAAALAITIALVVVGGGGGCGAGNAVARVTVISDSPIAGVSLLTVTATVGGVTAASPNDFPQNDPITISNAAPHVFGLRFDKDHIGALEVSVVVLDTHGVPLGHGTGGGRIEASMATEVTVVLLPGAPPPDMAMPLDMSATPLPDMSIRPDMPRPTLCTVDTSTFDDGCIFGP